MTELDEDMRQIALGEWSRRVRAEYASTIVTQELTLWLLQLGAPPDLISDGMRIAGEELNHAKISLAIVRELGGSAPALDTDSMRLARSGSFLESTLRAVVRYFCVGETVAVPLFSNLRRGASIDSVVSAIETILRDEVGHRQFGWDCLDWILGAYPGDIVTPILDRCIPESVQQLRASYASSQQSEIPDGLRAWGLAPPKEYADIFEATIASEYIPRFRSRGVEPHLS